MTTEQAIRHEDEKRTYLVHKLTEEGMKIVEQEEKPLLGGYISQKKYGNPSYCPTATRWHKKSQLENNSMPNLIYFDSVETAVALGYDPCGSCWVRGEMALIRWQEYLAACVDLEFEPVQAPKVIQNIKQK
jgi:hypothetical protein